MKKVIASSMLALMALPALTMAAPAAVVFINDVAQTIDDATFSLNLLKDKVSAAVRNKGGNSEDYVYGLAMVENTGGFLNDMRTFRTQQEKEEKDAVANKLRRMVDNGAAPHGISPRQYQAYLEEVREEQHRKLKEKVRARMGKIEQESDYDYAYHLVMNVGTG